MSPLPNCSKNLIFPGPQPELLYCNAHQTLQQKFHISRALAQVAILQCPQCVQFHHPPRVGINPRGLIPLKIWQMDVTHVPAFGKLKYVHVSIDTCSGIMYASPMSGEKKPAMLLAIA